MCCRPDPPSPLVEHCGSADDITLEKVRDRLEANPKFTAPCQGAAQPLPAPRSDLDRILHRVAIERVSGHADVAGELDGAQIAERLRPHVPLQHADPDGCVMAGKSPEIIATESTQEHRPAEAAIGPRQRLVESENRSGHAFDLPNLAGVGIIRFEVGEEHEVILRPWPGAFALQGDRITRGRRASAEPRPQNGTAAQPLFFAARIRATSLRCSSSVQARIWNSTPRKGRCRNESRSSAPVTPSAIDVRHSRRNWGLTFQSGAWGRRRSR
jgi:hypothetical protein